MTPGKFCTTAVLVLALVAVPAAQAPVGGQPDAAPRAVNDRIRLLQQEAERLTAEAHSLVGELRRLELERDRRNRDATAAEAAALAARQALQHSSDRLQALEQERIAQLPDLQTQLVDLYKWGQGRHARLLLGSGSLREFARARRAVAALIAIHQERLAAHRRVIGAVRDEHAALERTAAELQAHEAEAQQARAAAARAVEAHLSLVALIESQRDLSARYVSELETLYQRLLEQVPALAAPREGGLAPAAGPPPSRGQLPWPASGQVIGRYGDTAGRLGGTAVRNGIELAAPEGTPVRAVHAGMVSFAGEYTGFGTLVILHHGEDHYSLYGYLGAVHVVPGERAEAGAELGQVGFAPAGPPALYFELRIDGQSVDPVQWLEPR